MKGWGLVLVGAGIGGVVGGQVGDGAAVSALVVGGVGALLLILGVRGRAGSRDIVGDAMAERAGGARKERPSLAGLGTQVEKVLSLAEEQAADHIAEAKATAEQIV